jgi:alpha-1,3-rhamnosyltransferase
MNSPAPQNKPEVFVLVPSYNHAPFIEKCLKSIINQTLAPKKLLVIDDGSKDSSVAAIERALAGCPFEAELVTRENRGLSATLNEGFARSEGCEYFAYLGSDDVWLPEFLSRQTALLASRPGAVLAFGHAYLIDEEDRIIDSTRDWTDYADGRMLDCLLRGIIPASSSVLYRRAALEKHRWNEDSVLEDYELYLKLAVEGEFARNELVSSAWRQHGWNVSGDFPLMLAEWLRAQTRVGGRLGLTEAELARRQRELKFNAVFDYIRHGAKRGALELFRENLGGARSPAQIGRMLFRLAVPNRLFQWNRRRKRLRNAARYGKLEI